MIPLTALFFVVAILLHRNSSDEADRWEQLATLFGLLGLLALAAAAILDAVQSATHDPLAADLLWGWVNRLWG